MKATRNLFNETGAIFSGDRLYRYSLYRRWKPEDLWLVFCMLNPSVADDIFNDPTVERCQKRAERMGYSGLEVVNIFAYRSTDPHVLESLLGDPIGPENDAAILKAARRASLFICGWGAHGKILNRGNQVLKMVRDAGVIPYTLKLNGDKTPQHPLYCAYSRIPFPMPSN